MPKPFKTAHVDNETITERASRTAPLLFLHLPKTAGTSFYLTLLNLFGDAHVLRLAMEAPGTHAKIEQLLAEGDPELSCLTGHLPAFLFGSNMEKFRGFTILRNPIQRVMSLHRFLHEHTPAELATYGLAPGFSFDDFITGRHPRLYSQVNNGMTRMLCNDERAVYSQHDLFWKVEDEKAILDTAVSLLEQIDFGLSERMEETLDLFSEAFQLQYKLPNITENTTDPGSEEGTAANIRKIAEANILDIALYEHAAALFARRLGRRTLRRRPSPSAIFRPEPGIWTSLDRIPGRQGFYAFEPVGFAWLQNSSPSIIHYLPPARKYRIKVRLYAVAEDYPFERMVLRLDGRIVRFQVEKVDRRWSHLTSPVLTGDGGMVSFEIKAPYSLPVQHLQPNSRDPRSLSVAVRDVALVDEKT